MKHLPCHGVLAATLLLSILSPSLSVAADCREAAHLATQAAEIVESQPAEAEKLLGRAVGLCGDSAALRYNLARVQAQQGRYTQAERSLDKALELRPDYAKAFNDLAYLNLTKPGGDTKRALALAQRALELEPGNPDFRDTLVRAEGQYYPADLTLEVTWADANGNGVLEAGEAGTLSATVTNQGRGTARNVRVIPELESAIPGLHFDAAAQRREALLPGAQATFAFAVRSDELTLPTGTLAVTLSNEEQRGFYADSQRVTIATRALVPPEVVVADIGVRDQNENGQIEPQEIVELTARIQNRGAGAARGVVARVELGTDVYATPDTVLVHELGDLAPGEYRDLPLSVFTSKRAKAIDVAIGIQEERERFNSRLSLDLAFNRPEKRTLAEVAFGAAAPVPGAGFVVPDVGGLSVATHQPPVTGASRPDAVAVVIGNKTYENRTLAGVEFAQRDAQVMKEYLVKTLGFAEQNIFFELDADKADFEKLFGDATDHRGLLYDRVKTGVSDVFVFYSGHGFPDVNTNKAYLVPVNADPIALKLTAYPLDVLAANLAQLNRAKQPKSLVVLLDACFSGGYDGGMLVADASPLFIEYQDPLARLGGDNAAVITSSQGNQVSSWYREKRHGLFTWLVLTTLKQAAEQGRSLTVGDLESALTGPDGVNDLAWKLHRRKQEPLVVGNRGVGLL